MGFTKITEEDIKNKGVVGLPDTPNLSTADMQAKFDELALTVIIPKINNLIAEIEAVTASESIGIVIDDEIGVEKNLQSAFSYLHELVKAIGVTGHSHENKEIIDSITEELLYELNEITVLLKDIESVSNEINGSETAVATCKAVTDYVQELGGGDMTRAMYDANKNGIVDNSEMLGGKLPEYYQSAEDDSLETSSKNVVGAINELKITLDNVDVEGLSTMEQVEACTDPEQPVGAGAIQELNDSLGKHIYIKKTLSMTNYSNVLVGNLSELTNGKVTMDNFKGLSICISQSGTIFCLPLISSDGEIRLYTTTGDPVTISFDIYMDIAYM